MGVSQFNRDIVKWTLDFTLLQSRLKEFYLLPDSAESHDKSTNIGLLRSSKEPPRFPAVESRRVMGIADVF
jgi:hypothetical protein